MKLNRKFIFLSAAFGGTFVFFFWRAYKSSDRKGLKRFLVSVKIAGLLTFASFGSTATAKDTGFLPGSDAFTSQPSIVRPTTHSRSFGTETATGAAGSPKPGSGSGSSSSGSNSAGHSPAVPNGRMAPKPIDRPDVFEKKKSFNEEQCPVGEMSRGPTSEMIISSQHQDRKVIITDRDVKKFMTPEDRKRFDDQIFNEKIYKNEIGIRVKYPDEVYTKNYQGKLSTIYLEKSKTAEMEAIVAIVDNKSGRLKLSSTITAEEYQNLININVDLELTDLRRDPQTGVRNVKSVKEANTMERAKEQGLVESYRRPKVYLGETDVDFVNLNGSKKYELKAVTQNERKSYQDSAKDIIKNIQNQAEKMKVGETLPDYLIDLEGVPDSLKWNIAQNIQDQLQSIKNLDEFNFIY